MAVVIREIVTEVVVAPEQQAQSAAQPTVGEDALETVVRRATERVLEILRREWDR